MESDPRKPFAARTLGAVVVAVLAAASANGAPSPDPSLSLTLTDPVHERAVEGEFLFDATGAAQTEFRTKQLPSHVLLDASGEVVLRAPSLDDEVESTIERMMLEHTRGTGDR